MNKQMPAIEFRPDDFQLKGADTTRIDMNFASQSFWKDALGRFRANKGAVFSLIVILLIILLAIVGPLVSGYTYQQQDIKATNLAPRMPGLENMGIFDGSETIKTSTGSKEKNAYVDKKTGEKNDTFYWFGSDALGRDIWTRTWTGTRISLYIAVIAVLIDMLLGMGYGLISGYFGGRVDSLMQRFTEIVNSIPTLVIVTLLMLVLKPGLATITLALMITGWIGMSRIARAQMLKLKEQEFVLASHTLGASNFRVIFSEILPNIIGQLITNTMFSIPNAIFTEAFLSFVGLGIPEPMCSLGSLISYAFKNFTTHPFQIVPPVIVLALLMLCFNMLADGLRDAFDPKMKEM
jgi:oligopeptide transport system permease protein